MFDVKRPTTGRLFTTIYHNPDGSAYIYGNKEELKQQIDYLQHDPNISNVFAIAVKKAVIK